MKFKFQRMDFGWVLEFVFWKYDLSLVFKNTVMFYKMLEGFGSADKFIEHQHNKHHHG